MGSKHFMDEKITLEELRKSVESSGYLIEQRIEPILEKYKYYVEKNDVYKDDETGKSREIDLTAINAIKLGDDFDFLFYHLLVECENNKQPIVFFRSDSPIKFLFHYDIKFSGTPSKIYISKSKTEKLTDFFAFEKFHHYCKGFHSTQYCTFQKPKQKDNDWIAFHSESQHDSIKSLIKCLKFFIDRDYKGYYLPEKVSEEPINLNFYYPLIVLQGDLFEAFYDNKNLILEPRNMIQYRQQEIKKGETETFQIDIIKESFLEEYLKLIEKEMKKVGQKAKYNIEQVKHSVKRVVKELMKSKNKKEMIEVLRS